MSWWKFWEKNDPLVEGWRESGAPVVANTRQIKKNGEANRAAMAALKEATSATWDPEKKCFVSSKSEPSFLAGLGKKATAFLSSFRPAPRPLMAGTGTGSDIPVALSETRGLSQQNNVRPIKPAAKVSAPRPLDLDLSEENSARPAPASSPISNPKTPVRDKLRSAFAGATRAFDRTSEMLVRDFNQSAPWARKGANFVVGFGIGKVTALALPVLTGAAIAASPAGWAIGLAALAGAGGSVIGGLMKDRVAHTLLENTSPRAHSGWKKHAVRAVIGAAGGMLGVGAFTDEIGKAATWVAEKSSGLREVFHSAGELDPFGLWTKPETPAPSKPADVSPSVPAPVAQAVTPAMEETPSSASPEPAAEKQASSRTTTPDSTRVRHSFAPRVSAPSVADTSHLIRDGVRVVPEGQSGLTSSDASSIRQRALDWAARMNPMHTPSPIMPSGNTAPSIDVIDGTRPSVDPKQMLNPANMDLPRAAPVETATPRPAHLSVGLPKPPMPNPDTIAPPNGLDGAKGDVLDNAQQLPAPVTVATPDILANRPCPADVTLDELSSVDEKDGAIRLNFGKARNVPVNGCTIDKLTFAH